MLSLLGFEAKALFFGLFFLDLLLCFLDRLSCGSFGIFFLGGGGSSLFSFRVDGTSSSFSFLFLLSDLLL